MTSSIKSLFPNPYHGDLYRVVYTTANGHVQSRIFAYNGYEFDQPFNQGIVEARAQCSKFGHSFLSVLVVKPILEIHGVKFKLNRN